MILHTLTHADALEPLLEEDVNQLLMTGAGSANEDEEQKTEGFSSIDAFFSTPEAMTVYADKMPPHMASQPVAIIFITC